MAPTADLGHESPLLERERELRALRDALDRLTEGLGSMLLVEGAAGVGKSRLLGEAVELARRHSLLVRSARAGQLEREMPFGVVRQLLEPVIERASGPDRSRLLSGSARLALIAFGQIDPGHSSSEGDSFAPIHGLYWLLANVADSQPVVLVIDDAQWADAQSLRWLDYLARRVVDTPVLVVVSARTGEADEPADLEPLRLEANEVLHPSPLSRAGIDQLIEAALGKAPSDEFSKACRSATGGNPFLLAEVLRALRAGAVGPEAEAAHAIGALGPEPVARHVLTRLARFGSEAVFLARAIAVLGGAPQLRHAAKLAGIDEDRARELCDRLRDAEILAPGLPIDFVHPVVRTTIYREQSEEDRSASHRRAAKLLSETGIAAAEIAPHLLACAPNGDEWVVEQLREAARAAFAEGAPKSAKAYLERAIEEAAGDEHALAYQLGRVLTETDPARAAEVLDTVAEHAPDPGLRIRALGNSAVAHFSTGRVDEAVRRMDSLEEALPHGHTEHTLPLEAQRYCMRILNGTREHSTSERIRAVAAGAGTSSRGECLARQALAMDRFLDCDPVEEVVELAASFPPPPWERYLVAPSFGCIVLAFSGRWNDARRAMELWTESAHKNGSLVAVSYGSSFLAMIDRLRGRLADAEAEARTAWNISAELAPALPSAWGAIGNLIAALIARGDVEEAARLADGIDLSAGLGEAAISPWPLEIRGYLRLAQGRIEEGVDDLLVAGEQAEAARIFNPACTAWRSEVAPALAALDRTAEAREIIAEGEKRARAFGAPHVIGTIVRSRALIEPKSRGIRTLRDSVAALKTGGPPHELARSLLELGAALRRGGQRSESREPLRAALELAHSCGAGGLECGARDELAAAGSRPRSVFRTGVASLTASELRTTRLAAEGLSNVEIAQRLFVTRKTVEKHLGNAYTKLEISSRKELAVALAAPGGN